MYRPKGSKVERKTRNEIELIAKNFRDLANSVLGKTAAYFDLAKFLTLMHDDSRYEFEIEVVEDRDLPHAEALADPARSRIILRESVYDGLMDGQRRARFTVAHEFGHLLMHNDLTYAFSTESYSHNYDEDSEWQANTFAAGFLIDKSVAKGFSTANQISNTFGVSIESAMIYMKNMKR